MLLNVQQPILCASYRRTVKLGTVYVDICTYIFTAAKLASIFTKSKAAATKDDDVQVIAVDIDPELARVRREFLLSGVPDTLRRQQIVTSAQMAAGDYAPLPTVSHVQQSGCHGNREDVVDPWSLGDVGLPLRSAAEHEELGRDSKLVTPLGQFTGCDRSTLTSDTTQLAREADLPSQVGTGCDRSTLTSDTTQLARETDLPSQVGLSLLILLVLGCLLTH